MQHSKWLAKLGAVGYDSLIIINSMVNWCLTALGRQKMSFSQRIKGKFKDAVRFINHFEQTAADLAVDKRYDYVICGHIHHADIREIKATDNPGSVLYLNSGDWVESLTALEYNNGKWSIFKYNPANFMAEPDDEDQADTENLNNSLDIKALLEKFKLETH